MNTEMTTYEILPQGYEEALLQKRRMHKRRIDRGGMMTTLTITSLMDILTILLVFLLKSYSTDPLNIESSPDLKLPASTASDEAKPATSVTVSRGAIMVNNSPVVSVRDGAVAADDKRGGADSYFITALAQRLTDEMTKERRIKTAGGTANADGTLNIIMDEQTPYRLITEVMYTAGQAEFKHFRFAIMESSGEN